MVAERTAQLQLENEKLKQDIAKYKKERNENLKQAEAALRESEDRYRTLIELGNKIGEAVVMLQDIDGKEGMHAYVSDQWPIITGYSKEELLKVSFFDLVNAKDRAISIKRHVQKMAGKSIPDLFELSIMRKDGTEISIEITSAATSYKGRNVNVAYIRDITERKQTEQLLEEERDKYIILLEHTPVAIWEHDLSGGMLFINKLRASGVNDFEKYFCENLDDFAYFLNFAETINANPACSIVYGSSEPMMAIQNRYDNPVKKINELNDEKEVLFFKGIINPISQMIEGCSNIPVKEYPIPAANGKPKFVRASFSVAPGHDSDLSLVFGAAIDITDRVKAENELLEYKNQLEDIIKERTTKLSEVLQREQALSQTERELHHELESRMKQQIDFNRMLVHELKTPLVPLLGTSSILMQELKEEPYHSLIANVNSGAVSLLNRIDELLDLEKADAGTLTINQEEVDISSLLRHVFSLVSAQAQEKEQVLTLNIPPVLPSVIADNERIQQILLNLLSNAIKYTPYSSRITLRGKTRLNCVVIEVQDNGPGMSAEKQGKLFSPYYYLDGRESHRSGFGIGLALCKRLIELQNGTIWVDSTPGQGSTFGFSLPAINEKGQHEDTNS